MFKLDNDIENGVIVGKNEATAIIEYKSGNGFKKKITLGYDKLTKSENNNK